MTTLMKTLILLDHKSDHKPDRKPDHKSDHKPNRKPIMATGPNKRERETDTTDQLKDAILQMGLYRERNTCVVYKGGSFMVTMYTHNENPQPTEDSLIIARNKVYSNNAYSNKTFFTEEAIVSLAAKIDNSHRKTAGKNLVQGVLCAAAGLTFNDPREVFMKTSRSLNARYGADYSEQYRTIVGYAVCDPSGMTIEAEKLHAWIPHISVKEPSLDLSTCAKIIILDSVDGATMWSVASQCP